MEENSGTPASDFDFDFAQLRRFPDIEAENLFAHDATDELILREAHQRWPWPATARWPLWGTGTAP